MIHTNFNRFINSLNENNEIPAIGARIYVYWNGNKTKAKIIKVDGDEYTLQRSMDHEEMKVSGDELKSILINTLINGMTVSTERERKLKAFDDSQEDYYANLSKEEIESMITDTEKNITSKRNFVSHMGYAIADNVLDDIDNLEKYLNKLKTYL